MADPNSEINFKKNLLDENDSQQKKLRIIQVIVDSVALLAIIGYFVYQGYTQPKNNPVEILPNTSRNRSDNANNFSSNLNANSSVSAKLNSQAESHKNNSIFGSDSYGHTDSAIKLGKQDSNLLNVLYYFHSAGPRFASQGLGTVGFTMTVTQFNTTNKQLSVSGSHSQYLTGICGDSDQETSYDKKCKEKENITKETQDQIKAYNSDYRDALKLYGYQN